VKGLENHHLYNFFLAILYGHITLEEWALWTSAASMHVCTIASPSCILWVKSCKYKLDSRLSNNLLRSWVSEWERESVTYNWGFTASQFVLATSPLRFKTSNIFFPTEHFEIIVLMQHPLWREAGSVVYNCCWSSPAQSFSGPTSAGLVSTFYCLKFETPPTWRAFTILSCTVLLHT
jgi:hypothetical protein